MKKYTILIDIDDTIEDLCDAWCRWLNKKHSTKVKRKHITDWEIAKFFPELTEDEVFAPLFEREFWKTVKPKRGASKYVKRLINDGHDIYFCTTTNYKSIQMKYEEIIIKYFPYVDWSRIIVTSNKHLIDGDILIDDNPKNMGFNSSRRHHILMAAPHNNFDKNDIFYSLCPETVRLKDWREIYKTIKEWSE